MLNKVKPYILLILKWLLLPLLLAVVGQFLEGPPTRIVVRRGSFIFCCFALSLVAANYLHRSKWMNLSIGIYALQGLFIPTGFILMAHRFYNGGKDMAVHQPLLFLSLLMILNGLVFLRFLFSIHNPITERERPK